MDPLFLIAKIGIYAVMGVTVLAALGAVNLPNLFHAALALAAALVGVALIFVALGAEFLAVVQALLYVGPIMTLVIFAIMLTHGLGSKGVKQRNELGLGAAGACLAFFALLFQILRKTAWPVNPQNLNHRISTADLGNALMGHFVFPFEVISVVLLAALIGAILIAKKERES